MSQVTEITIDQLYDFKTCPLRFKLKEIDKLPRIKSEEEVGLRGAILATLSYYYTNLHEGKLLTLEEMKEKFTSIFFEKNKIYNIQFDSKNSQRKKEIEAYGMLAAFHRQQKFNPDKTVAVNLDFRVKIDTDFYVTGRIPVIRETSRGHEIVTFKTSSQRPTEFHQKTDMTLTLMAIAFHSMFRQQANSIVLHHLRTGTPYFVDRKQKDYQRLYKSVKMMKESMDRGWYYPNEGYQCATCPAQNYCMEWR